MKLFVGLDVSLEKTAICVISEPEPSIRQGPCAVTGHANLRCSDQLVALAG